MLQVLSSLNYVHVIVVAIVGFMVGGVWYSFLFNKAWMAEMKITPEMAKEKGGGGKQMLLCFLLTIISTTTLAVLAYVLGVHDPMHGAKLGFYAGTGFVAVRHAANSLFNCVSLKLYLIVAAQDVVALAVQGAILGAWH